MTSLIVLFILIHGLLGQSVYQEQWFDQPDKIVQYGWALENENAIVLLSREDGRFEQVVIGQEISLLFEWGIGVYKVKSIETWYPSLPDLQTSLNVFANRATGETLTDGELAERIMNPGMLTMMTCINGNLGRLIITALPIETIKIE